MVTLLCNALDKQNSNLQVSFLNCFLLVFFLSCFIVSLFFSFFLSFLLLLFMFNCLPACKIFLCLSFFIFFIIVHKIFHSFLPYSSSSLAQYISYFITVHLLLNLLDFFLLRFIFFLFCSMFLPLFYNLLADFSTPSTV